MDEPKRPRQPKQPWARGSERFETYYRIEVDGGAVREMREGRVVNIGSGGMFLSINYPLPSVGDRIYFRIRFEDDTLELLEGIGVIRWIRTESAEELPVGCGIEFSELTQKSDEILEHLIRLLRAKERVIAE